MERQTLIKLGIFVLLILILSVPVDAFGVRTIFNPFTSRLDYIRTGNFTDENLTADFFIGNGSLLTSLSGDGFWPIDDIYLNNVYDVLTFNETLLNITIDARDTFNTTQQMIDAVNGQVNSTSWNRSGTNVFLADIGDSVGIGVIPDVPFHFRNSERGGGEDAS